MITIVRGDATKPTTDGRNIIVHGVNTIGAWGAGFVLAVDKISSLPRIRYRAWAKNKETYCYIRKKNIPFLLGNIQIIIVKPKLAVCNMVSQVGCGARHENGEWVPAARYSGINAGFIQLDNILHHLPAAHIHLPMIGAGLGGLSFDRVYDNIHSIFTPGVITPSVPSSALSVNIYGFTKGDYDNLKDIQKTHESRGKDLTHGVSMI